MLPRLTDRFQAIVFVGLLIAAIAGLYGLTQVLQPSAVQGAVVEQVHLEVTAPGWTIRYDPPATANNTAFGLLLEASAKLGFPVRFSVYKIPQGVLVTEINGSRNGQDQRYWQYWVDGAYGSVAADHMALRNDDRVLWRFTASLEGG